jgi:hypothetical protein
MNREPIIPDEVWTFTVGGLFYAKPIDDDGTDVAMWWPTKEQAQRGMRHQIDNGWYEAHECMLVRIK